MSAHDDDTVAAGTRRVVGREALRRLSGMVREWEAEEAAKTALARHLLVGLGVLGLAAFALFNWLYR